MFNIVVGSFAVTRGWDGFFWGGAPTYLLMVDETITADPIHTLTNMSIIRLLSNCIIKQFNVIL